MNLYWHRGQGTYKPALQVVQNPGSSKRISTCVSIFRRCGHQKFANNNPEMRKNSVALRSSKVTATTNTEAGVDIPGISKVFNPNASKNVRLFWGVIVGCCAATCFHQLSERIGNYLNFTTTLDTFVVRNQTITFPAITICPTLTYSINAVIAGLQYYIQKACAENSTNLRDKCPTNDSEDLLRHNYNLTDLHITEDDLWQYFTIDRNQVNATVLGEQFGISKNYIPFNATYTNITTYWGMCVVITPDKPMEYRGPYTLIHFEVKRTGVMFFLSNKDIEQRHDAFFLAEPLLDKRYSDIRLGTKQFNFLNTSREPCKDEVDVVECRNRCIDKLMDEKLKCRVKFMINSKLKPCSTTKDLGTAHIGAQDTYAALKSGQCSCMRKCRETFFSVTTDVAKHLTANETHFELYYPDNLHEIVQESYAYSLSALLSDIGGTLGFYLGFCVVTVIEVIEELFRNLVLALKAIWCCSKKKFVLNNSVTPTVKT